MCVKIKSRTCPVCEKNDKTDMTWILKDEHFMKSELSKVQGHARAHLELNVCNFCKLIFYSKYPDLNDLYKDSYRADLEFGIPSRVRENSIKCALWASLLFPFLKELKEKTILDIGCAEGFWVQYLNGIGFKAEGLEINKKSVEFATKSGTPIYDCDILSHHKKYDFIFNSGYLEHVENPKQILEHLRDNCLNENGYIYIGTPDADCSNHQYLSEFFAPEHYQTFNTLTLQNLLYSCGYKVINVWRDVYNYGIAILAQKTSFKSTEPLSLDFDAVSRLSKLKISHDSKSSDTLFLNTRNIGAEFEKIASNKLNGNMWKWKLALRLINALSIDMVLRIFYELKDAIEKSNLVLPK